LITPLLKEPQHPALAGMKFHHPFPIYLSIYLSKDRNVGVNSEDSYVRTRLPPPLAGGLLETLHLTPKTNKETVVNLYLQMGAKDS
jgi:hypothetical protein